ncbi:MAG: diaminopropionate ammonia-lyase [Nitriliruptorales bacterium]
MAGADASARILENDRSRWSDPPDPDVLRPIELHRTLPEYEVTPLVRLDAVASRLGLAGVWLKDESWRLGLPSFKILGGAWAVHRLLLSRAGRPVDGARFRDLRAAAAEAGPVTLATATDGNHGRGVARMARLLGFDAVVYVPEGTAPARIDGIAEEGARVVVHDGNYDEAVARAASDAAEHGWEVVADVAYDGYVDVPTWVMDGYDTIFEEADGQLPDTPTAVVLQAGVGAFTGAALRHYLKKGGPRPRFATIEPLTAACLLASAEAGEAVTIDAGHESIMAGLNCGSVSTVAWPYIRAEISVFAAIHDDRAREAMRLLADAGVVAGESGAAALGGLLELATHDGARAALALDADAHVLLVNTEGATDPVGYKATVGRSPEDVRAGS